MLLLLLPDKAHSSSLRTGGAGIESSCGGLTGDGYFKGDTALLSPDQQEIEQWEKRVETIPKRCYYQTTKTEWMGERWKRRKSEGDIQWPERARSFFFKEVPLPRTREHPRHPLGGISSGGLISTAKAHGRVQIPFSTRASSIQGVSWTEEAVGKARVNKSARSKTPRLLENHPRRPVRGNVSSAPTLSWFWMRAGKSKVVFNGLCTFFTKNK